MKQLLFIIVFLSLKVTLCLSQSEVDTLMLPVQIIDQGDSLISQNDPLLLANPEFSDTLYKQRLATLSFSFDMTYNPVVKRYIELYTVKIKNKLAVIIGLSEFYFPIFEDVLRANQLPLELKYIPVIESALNARAVSPARAVGLWQFMKGTGKENGLIINNYVDQRRAIVESTQAAAKYLKNLYRVYGNWQLVLAAYDCGPGSVNRAIRRAGGKSDFWEIYRYLPRETRVYIPAYIGAAYAMNYYKEHNIQSVTAPFPKRTDTIQVLKNLYLKQVSEILGIDIEMLRRINPEYRKDFIPASESRTYTLHLPSEQKARFIELQDSIYGYRSKFFANELRSKNAIAYKDNASQQTKVIHRVRAGESISRIAGQYHVSVKNIKDWNKLTSNKINLGQKLVVRISEKAKHLN